MRRRQLRGLHANRVGREIRPVDAGRIVSTAGKPFVRTSAQIRSTTCCGESGSPNTSIVRRRPASLTIFPRGLSRLAQLGNRLPDVRLAEYRIRNRFSGAGISVDSTKPRGCTELYMDTHQRVRFNCAVNWPFARRTNRREGDGGSSKLEIRDSNEVSKFQVEIISGDSAITDEYVFGNSAFELLSSSSFAIVGHFLTNAPATFAAVRGGACLGAVVNLGIYQLAYDRRRTSPWLARLGARCRYGRRSIGFRLLVGGSSVGSATFSVRSSWSPHALGAVLRLPRPHCIGWKSESAGTCVPIGRAFGRPARAFGGDASLAVRHSHGIADVDDDTATFIDIDEQTIPDSLTIPGTIAALLIATVCTAPVLPIVR